MYDYKRNDYVDKYVSNQKKDLDFNFNTHPISGDIAKKTNIEAIKMALKSLILLNHYEKPFHPDIGCDIYKSLFELIDMPGTEEIMRGYIEDMINKYEPRVELNQVDILVQPDENNVEITIYFTPINDTNSVSLTLYLQILR